MLFLFKKGELLISAAHSLPEMAAEGVAEMLAASQVQVPFEEHLAAEVPADFPCERLCARGWQWLPLRQCFPLLPREVYCLAGRASELLTWRLTHRFCPACGAEVSYIYKESPHIVCPKCRLEAWPEVTPAVIVRICRRAERREDDEILLVQARNFRSDFYGLVAGFVESGESAESAVLREVEEETSLRIENLRYFASQPWPFPHSLMLGFTADYASGTLRLQESELRKGGWFRRDALPAIPDAASLARRLIDDWLAEV